MRNQRSRYRAERNRSNRDGGIGMATYRLDRAKQEYADRWKGYNIARTLGKRLTGKPVPGQRLTRRRKK